MVIDFTYVDEDGTMIHDRAEVAVGASVRQWFENAYPGCRLIEWW